MKLNREILRLAVPSIFANITVPLVGMVDIAVVGHLGVTGDIGGAAFIGGISIGTMIFDLLYWNFAFLRAGTGGLTAQAYGRLLAAGVPFRPADTATNPAFGRCANSASLAHGNPSETGRCANSARFAHGDTPDNGRCANSARFAHGELGRILLRALRIALLAGLALIALQWVAVKLAFLVVKCSPEVQSLASQYFYIRIWAAPATLSLFAFKGWFIGLQDSVRPMTADLLVNLLNIVLSAALAFGWAGLPRLGFTGVAFGTVIAQWSGFLYCLLTSRRRHRHLFASHSLSATSRIHVCANGADMNQENVDSEALTFGTAETTDNTEAPEKQSFFSMNRDLVLRSAGMIAVYIGFTVISARFGDKMLSVSAILMKLLMLFSYFTDGFAYAGEALTGRFIGECSADGVRSTVRGTFAWGAGVAALFMLVYGFGGVPVLHLMTSDQSVVEAGREFLPWLLLMPMIGCPAFVWDGVFIGATATKDLRNSTLLSAIGFFGAWFAGIALAGTRLTPELAIHILMAAYFVHLAIRTVYQTFRWKPLLSKVLPADNRQHEGQQAGAEPEN